MTTTPPPGAGPFAPHPVECPHCHELAAVAITRGFPGPELEYAIQTGKVEHRGCVIGPDDNDWICRACGHEWRDPD